MTLFSYVVRWDHGFAPNPFFNVCSLATCKPHIRRRAKKGDWVLGTGSAKRGFNGKAIFLMEVGDILTFNDYWKDAEFKRKRPVMNGSLQQRFGDNIYSRLTQDGPFQQALSRHSWSDEANERNLNRDTSVDRVLVGRNFTYWGDQAPALPAAFNDFVISRPGWKEDFTAQDVKKLVDWVENKGGEGQVGLPVEWRYERYWREPKKD